LVQSKLPDGTILQPFDSVPLNKEIYLWRVYTKFRGLGARDAFLSIAAYHVPSKLHEISNFLRNIGY
jgi:hypothetical protein